MNFEKDLIAASATPLILAILSDGSNYGYAIIKKVQRLSGSRMNWTDGMLYPVLHRLENNDFVESYWAVADTGRRRKYYRITMAGSKELARLRSQWNLVDSILRTAWSDGSDKPKQAEKDVEEL